MNPLSAMCANYKDTFCKMHEKWIAPYLTLKGMSSVAATVFHVIFIVLYIVACFTPAALVGWTCLPAKPTNEELSAEAFKQLCWALPSTLALVIVGIFSACLLVEGIETYVNISRERKWKDG